MRPQRDRNGKSQLDVARQVGDEDVLTKKGVVVVPGERYGAWDVDDDAAIIRSTRELRSAGLHGRSAISAADADATRAGGTPALPSGAAAAGADRDARPVDRDLQGAGSPDDPRRPGETVASSRALTRTQLRARKLTQRALSLRADGWPLDDIAHELAVARSTIVGWFTTHRREVTLEEIDTTLDQIAVPLATENLIHGLLEGDKDYTLETLKGRGKLRRHGEVDKLPSTGLPELVIRFEGGTNGAQSDNSLIAGGRIVGQIATPKQIEGVVLHSAPITDGDPDLTLGTGTVQVPRATPPVATTGDGEKVSSS